MWGEAMNIASLVLSKDGSVSLTKLAACTFHASLAFWVGWTTYGKGFDSSIWMLYGSFAVGHAAYDKTTAMVSAFKNKQIDKATP